MNSAIVTGASGRLGNALVSELTLRGIPTLGVSRLPSSGETQCEIERHDDILTLIRLSTAAYDDPERLQSIIPWRTTGSCVLFHLAWGAAGRLATPDVSLQISCTAAIADAIHLAKALGCTRVVNAGSQQERFVQDFLAGPWRAAAYPTNQGVYGAAKLIARDLGSILCYVEKIDFINVRFSTYVTPALDGPGYVSSVLRAISSGAAYSPPTSKQPTEIVPLGEVARAFSMIGSRGRNKADYYIGTGTPRTLAELFRYFELAMSGSTSPESAWTSGAHDPQARSHFDPEPLQRDIGFSLRETFEAFTAEAARR